MLQHHYLVPSIPSSVGERAARKLIDELKSDAAGAIMGEDACCDSLSHCNKYTSYILTDLKCNKIIAMELEQFNKAGSSVAMELQGLQLGFQKLQDENITVSNSVTDLYSKSRVLVCEH